MIPDLWQYQQQRYFLEAEYDEYVDSNASGAAFCRSAALILMSLLLLRHALTLNTSDADDDASTFFSLFLLCAAGFLLPCHIMAWAISVLQRQRQRQDLVPLPRTNNSNGSHGWMVWLLDMLNTYWTISISYLSLISSFASLQPQTHLLPFLCSI